MTRLDRLVGGARARLDWLGVEHEYVVVGPDGPQDFRTLVSRAEGQPGLHPDDPRARWLLDGTMLTADGREAEVATAPVAIGPGCSEELLARAVAAQTRLLDGLDGLGVEGYSTHLNVSVRDRLVVRTAQRFVDSHAVPMMLLLDRADSPGLLVRPRRERLELGGEYLTGDPLRAAAVFATASTLALRHRVPRHLRLPVKAEAARERYGFYVDRTAAGPDLYATGRATFLGDRTAQQQLERVWAWTRPAAVGALADEELRLVDEVVSGRAPLPLEAEPTVAVRRDATAAPFGAVLRPVRRGRLLLEPRWVSWDVVVLDVHDTDGGSFVLAVPGFRLEAFLVRLHAGALDAELHALMARRHALPVLVSSDQTQGVGAFSKAASAGSLLRGERNPLTGSITPPGGPGSREQKNQSNESSHHSAPRHVPKPKGLSTAAVIAGAAAAVLVVSGGAFAVVKATSGGDDPGSATPAAGSDDDPGGGSDARAGAADAGADGPEATSTTRTWSGSTTLATKPPTKGGANITITCEGDVCTVSGAPYMTTSFDLAEDLPLTGDPDGVLIYERAQRGSPCKDKWDWPLTVTFTPKGDTMHVEWLGEAVPKSGLMDCPGGRLASWSGIKASFDGKLATGG